MYLQNKYTRWYYNIIQRAQTRTISGYTEKHHIIPRSLGGNNAEINIVKLTAKEHFICHLLLTKMLTGSSRHKMIHAVWLLSNAFSKNQKRYSMTSKIYEMLKKEKSRVMSEKFGINSPSYGLRRSQETRNLQSIRRKGKTYEEIYGEDFANAMRLKRSVQNRPSGSSHKSSKHWVIITTEGERFEFIGGLVDFCKEHSFRYETIAKIANGFIPLRGKYKGWKVLKSAVS